MGLSALSLATGKLLQQLCSAARSPARFHQGSLQTCEIRENLSGQGQIWVVCFPLKTQHAYILVDNFKIKVVITEEANAGQETQLIFSQKVPTWD